jgi:hypothetical protein
MKMGASSKYGNIAPGDVKAMEGWMLSLVESYVTLTRLTNGSVASASAVARLKNLAEKHVDWQHGEGVVECFFEGCEWTTAYNLLKDMGWRPF